MKANELQVNDWVWVSDDLFVKVAQITKRKIGFHFKPNESKMYYARLVEIEPIEITEDVIEKCGFKPVTYKDEVLDFSELELYGNYIEINTLSNHIDREYYVHIDNADHDSIGGCDVQYLHQLQQIIRLATGKELEVKL